MSEQKQVTLLLNLREKLMQSFLEWVDCMLQITH